MPSGIATYHCDVKIANRFNKQSGLRQSAITAAAYRAGEDIHDKQTGLTYQYANKKGVHSTEILAPDNAPAWVHDRAELWNRSDEKDTYKTAQLFRNLLVSLPLALEIEDNREMTLAWAKENFVSQGMVADIAFHDMDSGNPHAHIMLTMRHLEDEGFGNKNRAWNKFSPSMLIPKKYRESEHKTLVEEWRENWSIHVNSHLEQAGIAERVSPASKAEQEKIAGLETGHLPQSAYHMENRGEATAVQEHKKSASIRNNARRQAARHEEQLNELYGVPDHQSLVDRIGAYWDNFQKRMIDDYIDRHVPAWTVDNQEILAAIDTDRGLEIE